MSSFNEWLDDDGLLNVEKNMKLGAENANLYSLQYILVFDNFNSRVMHTKLIRFITKSFTGKRGLYNQRHWKTGSKEDWTSPDSLIAIVGAFHIAGQHSKVKEIWSYLWRHCFTYDNLTGKTNFKRIMQPKAVLFTAICAGLTWLKPFLYFACMISCRGSALENSSGMLKSWTILMTFKSFKMLQVIEIWMGSWNRPFNVYYPMGHPLRSNI